jgi:RimJ/RimL family protein N-acetyltransferase
VVELTPLPEGRFPEFREHVAVHYAKDKVDAGAWSPEEAPRRARADLDALLPNGTSTRDHFLYEIRDASTAEEVGTLWFAVQDGGAGRGVWIYDIEIHAPFRRKGYAREALEAAEKKAADLGASKIELHVFGHNGAARALYEAAGYAPTSIVMSKQLHRR